jgi:Icc-related predicted phosphoesterase
MGEGIRIFFVTDVHGSNVCYRKFLNALKAYKVDVGILLGDLTGKVLVPLVEKAGGGWETTLMGTHTEAPTQEALDKLKKTIEMMGYYWTHQTPDEFRQYRDDPKKVDALFKQLMLSRLKEWIVLADERLAGTNFRVYMAAGNDDHLEPMLEELIAKVEDRSNAIFNFHAPPYGYALDLAPELSENLVQAADRKIHVGSRAVAKMIEKYQPLIGLHGHIHESRGAQKAKRTLLINPGSEYSEGILKGAVIVLEKGKVKDYVFTSG